MKAENNAGTYVCFGIAVKLVILYQCLLQNNLFTFCVKVD